ncbi:hypothetical protein Psfp_02332 [Pelotomaculum sp. FP]|uniref:hypothetical protein n=1 Tax=Pelotomaculum sp. FP TaxID=261474 RepID=UPI0010651DD6|nr:hypothetical protein [Pelotomaculum sp. FP]TEB15156.1 hypothetical protein Psfp_02332 [Pelotomaculum sp. FP]
MEEFTFKKSSVERYDIQPKEGFGWGIFTIDENNGLFNCLSDYGNYNYAWPNHGCPSFKHFLIEITRNWDYLVRKVAPQEPSRFNFEKTIKEWKQNVLRSRWERSCTKEEARKAWEVLSDLDFSDSAEMTQRTLLESNIPDHVLSWDDIVDGPIFDINASVKAFATILMPMFAEVLKEELGLKLTA